MGRGGLDEKMVLEGTGVGYLRKACEPACLFDGRGRPGDEDRGSKAGRSEGAGLLTPATVGNAGSIALVFEDGEESILMSFHTLIMTIAAQLNAQEVAETQRGVGR